jgi:hypothetical protein
MDLSKCQLLQCTVIGAVRNANNHRTADSPTANLGIAEEGMGKGRG